MRTAPIGYHNAVEAPLAFQDVAEQTLVMAVVLIIIKVVGTHESPYMSFGNGSLECRKIYFVKSTVVNDDIDLIAVFFVIVQSEMLYAGSHAVGLQSLNIRHHHT